MGWSSGGRLAAAVWNVIKTHIPEKHHKDVATELCSLFESYDCDTLHEAEELYDIVHDNNCECQSCEDWRLEEE